MTVFTYSRGYPRWLPDNLYTTIFQHFKCIIIKICIFWDVKMTYWHSCFWDAYICYAHNMSIHKTTFWEQFYIIWYFLCWCYSYMWRNKATFKCNIGGCHVQPISHWFLINWSSAAGSNPNRTSCEKATLCLQMVRWFLMENFLFCSTYQLAITQASEIILTTCHKTPKVKCTIQM